VVAYEIALRLVKQGEKIRNLVVIDAFAPISTIDHLKQFKFKWVSNFFHNLPLWTAEYLNSDSTRLSSRGWRRVRRTTKRAAETIGIHASWTEFDVLENPPDMPVHIRELMRSHIRALIDYKPPAYPGRILLIRRKSQSLSHIPDPELGWGLLAEDGVTIEIIDGPHDRLLEVPYARQLAKLLEKHLSMDGHH
jgi:thioesterase domain-containing protein